MKRCNSCGRDNADEAVRCSECGKREFAGPAAEAPPVATNKKLKLPGRLLIAGIIGLAVAGLSIQVAFRNITNSPKANSHQMVTEWQLRQAGLRVAEYQKRFNAFPDSFSDLLVLTNERLRWVLGSRPVDGWGRETLLVREGTNCLVVSYGRDGKPGGRGLDCDLTSERLHPEEAKPTFAQFWSEPPTPTLIPYCFVCGGLGLILTFSMIRTVPSTLAGWLVLSLKVGATVFGALMIASVMSVLHIPSGH
jgi:general secretion pathway protein G